MNFRWGASFDGFMFWFGLCLVIASVYLPYRFQTIETLILCLPIIPLGVLGIMNIRGAKLDLEKGLIRHYSDFLVFKIFHSSMEIKEFNQAVLKLHTLNQRMNMKSISYTNRTRVYEVYLRGKKGGVQVHETTDYKSALSCLQALEKKLPVEILNLSRR